MLTLIFTKVVQIDLSTLCMPAFSQRFCLTSYGRYKHFPSFGKGSCLITDQSKYQYTAVFVVDLLNSQNLQKHGIGE